VSVRGILVGVPGTTPTVDKLARVLGILSEWNLAGRSRCNREIVLSMDCSEEQESRADERKEMLHSLLFAKTMSSLTALAFKLERLRFYLSGFVVLAMRKEALSSWRRKKQSCLGKFRRYNG